MAVTRALVAVVAVLVAGARTAHGGGSRGCGCDCGCGCGEGWSHEGGKGGHDGFESQRRRHEGMREGRWGDSESGPSSPRQRWAKR